MRKSTKVFLIINIIALVGTAVLFSSVMSVISFDGGFGFNWSTQAIVGLVFAGVWLITGFVLFIRFLHVLSFPRKLFFVSIASTTIYAIFVFGLLNINSIRFAPVASFRQVSGVGTNATVIYVFVGIITVLYLVFLSITFRRLSRPIKKINAIVTDLSEGKKRLKFKVGGGREFLAIADGLQVIDKNLEEKDRLIRVASDEFEKVVPKQFLKYLGKNNGLELELGSTATKEVTTMFCDIRNSTIKSESLTLSDNFKFINDYLALITPIVRKHNGFVDKYLGDGVLAVFQDPKSAVVASKEIVRAVNIKNSLADKPFSIQVGIGIHTGEVVFGVVGDKDRKSPTIISDTVNYASKLQEKNKDLGTTLIVSKRTLNLVSNAGNFRFVGHLNFDDNTRFAIFENLDVLESEKRNALLDKRKEFEAAVRLFDEGNLDSAEKAFSSIKFHSNVKDNVTKYYLDKIKLERKKC